MSSSEKILDEIAVKIPGAKRSSMFGAQCIKAPNGKAVCMAWEKDMVFKLEGAQAEKAMAMSGSKMFSPAMGRVMNGWIQVSSKHVDQWQKLAEQSYKLVSALEAKPAKKTKKK